MRWQK